MSDLVCSHQYISDKSFNIWTCKLCGHVVDFTDEWTLYLNISAYNKRVQQGIDHALEYMKKRQELYAEWNTVWNRPTTEQETGAAKKAKLEAIDKRIITWERQAVVELHNLLFALDVVDRPMAS